MSGCCHRVINLSDLHIERNMEKKLFKRTMSIKILLTVLMLLLLLFGE